MLDTSGLLLQTIVSKEASAAGAEASTTATWVTYRHTERLATPIPRLRSGEDLLDGHGSERSSASVTIGLPVPPSSDELWASKGQWDGWSSQKVYAVLPLQEAGLPFAVDADWVPTSRWGSGFLAGPNLGDLSWASINLVDIWALGSQLPSVSQRRDLVAQLERLGMPRLGPSALAHGHAAPLLA